MALSRELGGEYPGVGGRELAGEIAVCFFAFLLFCGEGDGGEMEMEGVANRK